MMERGLLNVVSTDSRARTIRPKRTLTSSSIDSHGSLSAIHSRLIPCSRNCTQTVRRTRGQRLKRSRERTLELRGRDSEGRKQMSYSPSLGSQLPP